MQTKEPKCIMAQRKWVKTKKENWQSQFSWANFIIQFSDAKKLIPGFGRH